MKHLVLKTVLAAAVASTFISVGVNAAPIIYPAKGQSAQKQQQDDGECYSWAKTNTGVDPAAMGTPAAAAPTQPGGERVRGAARGALGGAAIGAIAGDAGKGAAIGAAAGTMRGGAQARQKESQQQATAQQASANHTSAIETYQRAYTACMQGRGYTVN